MRPRIGVLPLWDSGKEIFWMNPQYTLAIEEAGGLPVTLSLSPEEELWEDACHSMEGFVFSGGQDIDPAIYGKEKIPACHYQAPYRDRQELWMLRRLRELDKPVLGICRGLQIMNGAFGGTLYQDLPTQRPSPVCHLQSRPFTLPHHQVEIVPGTLLGRTLGKTHISVNSMHHQAVQDPAPGFSVCARSPDGLIEALELPEHRFFLGVQWHPEHLWQDYAHARSLWRGLVSAAMQG